MIVTLVNQVMVTLCVDEDDVLTPNADQLHGCDIALNRMNENSQLELFSPEYDSTNNDSNRQCCIQRISVDCICRCKLCTTLSVRELKELSSHDCDNNNNDIICQVETRMAIYYTEHGFEFK